jgi:tetratricopeptide (TPR) repeat protein/predicted aspartyl protease
MLPLRMHNPMRMTSHRDVVSRQLRQAPGDSLRKLLVGRIGVAALVLGAAWVPWASALGACKLGKYAEFPITMANLQPLVTAKINDHDVQFVVDSGAFYSMLSGASAAELDLKTHPPPFGFYVTGAGGGVTDVSIATVKVFTLAGVPLHNVEFLVGGSVSGSDNIGLLGQNVLHIGDVEYDLAQGVIRLMKAEDCRKALLAYWVGTSQPYSVIDIEPTSRARFHTIGSAFVNGKEIRVEFDTGAGTSILSLRAAERAGVKPDSPGVLSGGVSYGIGKNTYVTYIAPFASFKLGEEEIKNTRLRIGDLRLEDADMLIGPDFFLSHRVYVANSQNKLYFTYNGGPVFNLSGAKYAQAPSAPRSQAPADQAAAAAPATEIPGASASVAGAASAAGSAPAPVGADGGDAADLSRRGQALAARRDFEHALADLNRACELAPNDAQYRYQRAMIHWQMRQGELAMTDFDRAIELKPDYASALVARAELKFQGGDKPGTVADLDAADAVISKQANERLTMGAIYDRVDLLEPAIKQYDLWIANHDADALLPGALNGRCRARALRGVDLEAALKDCNAALKHASKASALYAQVADSRGLVFLRLGDYEKSIGDYDASLKVNSKNSWSLYGRGIDKMHLKKSAEGQVDMDAAAKIRPQVAEEFERRGIVP